MSDETKKEMALLSMIAGIKNPNEVLLGQKRYAQNGNSITILSKAYPEEMATAFGKNENPSTGMIADAITSTITSLGFEKNVYDVRVAGVRGNIVIDAPDADAIKQLITAATNRYKELQTKALDKALSQYKDPNHVPKEPADQSVTAQACIPTLPGRGNNLSIG